MEWSHIFVEKQSEEKAVKPKKASWASKGGLLPGLGLQSQ